MPKRSYKGDKRRRELEKRRKQEQKRKKRREGGGTEDTSYQEYLSPGGPMDERYAPADEDSVAEEEEPEQATEIPEETDSQ